MKTPAIRVGILACLILGLASALAKAQPEKPERATICEIKTDPPRFNHKLVEIQGFVSQGFEDFTFFDPTCPDWPQIWLEYGGKTVSGTMYCCGVTADRQRAKPLTVENISISLIEDDNFKEFDRLIHRQGGQSSIVHATLIGSYFAGTQNPYGIKSRGWGGYGHMGCCTLFAIQQIESVDPEDRLDLDYDRWADQPEIEGTGCSFRYLLPVDSFSSVLQEQKDADGGSRPWAYDDPRRVASNALVHIGKVTASLPFKLKELKRTPARISYRWVESKSRSVYMIVISRPYWLTFYASDPKQVAWTAIAVYRSSCEKEKSYTGDQ